MHFLNQAATAIEMRVKQYIAKLNMSVMNVLNIQNHFACIHMLLNELILNITLHFLKQ